LPADERKAMRSALATAGAQPAGAERSAPALAHGIAVRQPPEQDPARHWHDRQASRQEHPHAPAAMHAPGVGTALEPESASLPDLLQGADAQRFAILFDQCPLAMARQGIDGRIVRCNAALGEMLGYAADELVGRAWRTLLHPQELEEDGAGRYRLLSGSVDSLRVDRLYLHRAGHAVWAREFVCLAPDGDGGQLLSIFTQLAARGTGEPAVRRGVTGSQRFSDELQRQVVARTAELRAIVDSAFEGVVICEADGIVASVNPAASRMLGCEDQALVGQEFRVLLNRSESFQDLCAWAGPCTIAYRNRAGQHITLECSLRRIDGDARARVVALLRDVSRERRLDAQLRERVAEAAALQRWRTAGELAGVLAHRLNQPLAAIVSFAEATTKRLSYGEASTEKVLQALGDIAGQARRAADAIRELRTFLGGAHVSMLPGDVSEVVREVLELTRILAAEAKVEIHARLDEGLRPVMMRRGQVEQVLLNLLDNALEAIAETPSRVGSIEVSTVADGDEGVLVTVRDSGPGFDPDRAGRAFEAFHTTKPGGIGLGMSIARSIVEEHGGRIWVEPGQGCVRFTLPVAT
jgi:PAS domain S-box-containing protein